MFTPNTQCDVENAVCVSPALLSIPLAGATLTSKEKLDIARQLSKLGVDIIEAGFPVASPDDFEAVRSIALDVGNAVDEDGYVPVICGLSRSVQLICIQYRQHAVLPNSSLDGMDAVSSATMQDQATGPGRSLGCRQTC